MAESKEKLHPIDPVNGPCYYNKPLWEKAMCPIAKSVCQAERCLAFEYKVPDQEGRAAWFKSAGQQGDVVHCQCNALNTVFQTWDLEHVKKQMGLSNADLKCGDGKDGECERPA
jgi:hypothetical protein